jgi:hypothetical protein
MIKVDLRNDWKEFLRATGMSAYNLQFDESASLEANMDRYLNAKRRIPRQTRRVVHESRELCIPREYAACYSALKELMNDGGDLKPYLSRDIDKKKRADRNDGVLNAWGIQHLHFLPSGTPDVLLVKITDANVFVIQTLPHDRDVWVNTSLLQILHDNWPEMAEGQGAGIQGESRTVAERLSLRDRNANFASTMADGTVYVSPGGGVVASGRCVSDIRAGDQILTELANCQKLLEGNEGNLRVALNMSPTEDLSIKMIVENDGCWLYEPTKHVRLSLTIQP